MASNHYSSHHDDRYQAFAESPQGKSYGPLTRPSDNSGGDRRSTRDVVHRSQMVDPRTGARAFYTRDETSGAEARGYSYNSDNDPQFQKKYNNGNHHTVHQQVFVYSSTSPAAARPSVSAAREVRGRSSGGVYNNHNHNHNNYNNNYNNVVIEEAFDEEEDAEKADVFHPQGLNDSNADDENRFRQRQQRTQTQPIVEEPDDHNAGEDGEERRRRFHRRGMHEMDRNPFAAMESEMNNMHLRMARQMRGLMSLPTLTMGGMASSGSGRRERQDGLLADPFFSDPFFSDPWGRRLF